MVINLQRTKAGNYRLTIIQKGKPTRHVDYWVESSIEYIIEQVIKEIEGIK